MHSTTSLMSHHRLLEIVHADQKLYLVFEFLDMDLKRYIDTGNQNGTPITLDIVKVSYRYLSTSVRSPMRPDLRNVRARHHINPARMRRSIGKHSPLMGHVCDNSALLRSPFQPAARFTASGLFATLGPTPTPAPTIAAAACNGQRRQVQTRST